MRLNHSKTCNNKKLSPHSQPKQTSIKAFTLAETLTTLMIIGIVAALIMPAFTNNINNHIQQKRNATAIYKLSQITDKMKAAGDLDMIFSTTDEFVDIMAKHTKIAQRCDANNINNCFKTLMINNQKSPIKVEVKDLKTGEHLGRNKWKSDNVGIVLNDGTEMILNYNTDDCEPIGIFHQAQYTGTQSSTAGCLAAVIDTNGPKSPNALGKDIVLVNSHLPNSIIQVGQSNLHITFPSSAFQPVSYEFCEENKDEYGITMCCPPSDCPDGDYWMGALKYCKDLGLEPLTRTEGISFCNEIYAENFEGEFSKTLLSQAANQLWSSKDFKNSYAIMHEQNEEGKLGTHMGVVNMTSSKECYVQGLTDSRSIKPYAICKAK